MVTRRRLSGGRNVHRQMAGPAVRAFATSLVVFLYGRRPSAFSADVFSAAMKYSASSHAAWRAVLSNTHQALIALLLLTAAAKVASCVCEYFE